MAEITKFGASEVAFHIKHDLREIPEGKDYGNESIIPEKSKDNYSLLDRCQTAAEANKYRKQIEKECKAKHGKEIELWVKNDNYSAIEFYQKNNFAESSIKMKKILKIN